MSTTTSKGYKIPSTGDRGWYTDIEFDIQRTNDHTHDGVNSQSLSTSVFVKGTNTIAAASWVAVAGQAGTYKQTITLPAGFTVDNIVPKFYISGGSESGEQLYPSVRKISASVYDIYINDNSLTVVAIYG